MLIWKCLLKINLSKRCKKQWDISLMCAKTYGKIYALGYAYRLVALSSKTINNTLKVRSNRMCLIQIPRPTYPGNVDSRLTACKVWPGEARARGKEPAVCSTDASVAEVFLASSWAWRCSQTLKFLRSWASDIGTHRRPALCGSAVTFATHMLSETVYCFWGDPAQVVEANVGLRARRPRRPAFRGAEHSTLGQDARMGMTVILPLRQTRGLRCIACSDASLTFSLLWCCCLAYGAPLASQLVCPRLNLLPRHVARTPLGTHEQPVRCDLVGGPPRGVRRCSADECPGSCHHLSRVTPFGPQLVCPLLNLPPRHVTRALLGAHEHPVHCGLVGGLPTRATQGPWQGPTQGTTKRASCTCMTRECYDCQCAEVHDVLMRACADMPMSEDAKQRRETVKSQWYIAKLFETVTDPTGQAALRALRHEGLIKRARNHNKHSKKKQKKEALVCSWSLAPWSNYNCHSRCHARNRARVPMLYLPLSLSLFPLRLLSV